MNNQTNVRKHNEVDLCNNEDNPVFVSKVRVSIKCVHSADLAGWQAKALCPTRQSKLLS